MIHVPFDPETLPAKLKAEWKLLQDRAKIATDAIIEKWEAGRNITSDDFDTTVWRDIKQFLMDHVFHKKCAYCETNLAEARQDADAEHFRPKGGVNFKKKPEPGNRKYTRAIVADVSQKPAEEIAHPGYFWLAYNWKNLLPACRYCNSKDGKKNQFPVAQEKYAFLVPMTKDEAAKLTGLVRESKRWPGNYYLDFDDLDRFEERYLLHPYWEENPEKHIGFDEFGRIYVKEIDGKPSPLGKHSISAYDLWNTDLDKARQKEQERVNNLFDSSFVYWNNVKGLSIADSREKTWKEEKIVEVKKGETAYSRAALDRLKLRG